MNGRNILLVFIVLFIGYFSIKGFPTMNRESMGLDKLEERQVNVEHTVKNEDVRTEVESSNNEVLTSEKPVVLLFSANWCGACRQFKPYFKDAQRRIGDGYRYVIVDVDKNPKLARKFNFRTIPSVFIYDKEKNVTKKIEFRTVESFEKQLIEYLERRD